MIRTASFARRFRNDRSGIALLEFAFLLPIFMMMGLVGTELTNYIITRMRVSQMALHLADNAARIGTGSQLQAKTISETDINDLLTGTGIQSGELDIYNKGRVVISSVEPKASPNPSNFYKIGWQRCRGAKTSFMTSYRAGQASGKDKAGFGPAGQEITAPENGATMLVEVYYEYTPLVKLSFAPSTTMTEVASMMVRDRRDMSDDSATTNLHPNGVYKATGVTASTC